MPKHERFGIRTYRGSRTGAEPAPVLQSNRAARIRAAVFPGGQVRPSEIPFAGGLGPGDRSSGEQWAGLQACHPRELLLR